MPESRDGQQDHLLYAESMALRGKAVSMKRLLEKIEELVAVHEYSAFPGYARIGARRPAADEHARRQFENFKLGLPKKAA